MAISQAGYAAQFLEKDGTPLKFDDIGCMIRFVRENNRREAIAEFFVMDHNDKHWIGAKQGTYVKSEQTASPMASGLTAFRDPGQAQEYAAKNKGQVLQFDDLWKGDVAEPSHRGMNTR